MGPGHVVVDPTVRQENLGVENGFEDLTVQVLIA
jgi:hypothetical protein